MAETKTSPSPAWLYRFLNWVESTPLKGTLLIAVLLVVGAVLNHFPYWRNGLLGLYEFNPDRLIEASWFPLNVLIWLLMDRVARTALTDFGKGIGKGDREINGIINNFISVSWATVLVAAGLFFGGAQAITNAQSMGLTRPADIFVAGLWPTLGGIFEGMAVARILRQLFLVNSLYREVKKINLFNLWPVYALSRYGYTLAFYFIFSTMVAYLIINLLAGSGFALGLVIYTAVLSLVIFLAPLLGINTRLRKEKENELQRLGTQLDSVYSETETAVRKRKLSKVGELRGASSALKEQMETVQKVATWPWTPGSLRNLLLPILLPLFIGILQRYVLGFLGF